MYISMGTLTALVLAAWFGYVVMPELKEWSANRQTQKEIKAQIQKFRETYHFDERTQRYVRNDGQPLTPEEHHELHSWSDPQPTWRRAAR